MSAEKAHEEKNNQFESLKLITDKLTLRGVLVLSQLCSSPPLTMHA